jgi:hypothetical protein
LVGVTTDTPPLAIFVIGTPSILPTQFYLGAVPITGGTPTKIQDPFGRTDTAIVSGGAVGYWTDVRDGIGTFNVWTRANGRQTAARGASSVGLFSATEDGALVAFSVAGTATSADLVVASSRWPEPSPRSPWWGRALLTGNAAINLAASNPLGAKPPACPPKLGFVNQTFFAAYCTGTQPDTTAAHLYMVRADATSPTRLDRDTNAPGSVRPFWSTDSTGTKVFAIDSDATAAGRYIDVTRGAPGVTLDGGTEDGFMLSDGTAVIYRTASTVMRATTSEAPTRTSLVDGVAAVRGLLAVSGDQRHLMFNSLPPAGANRLVDIRIIDTSTPSQIPIDAVPTATAAPIGFTGTGTHALYFVNNKNNERSLTAKPVSPPGPAIESMTGIYGETGAYLPGKGHGGLLLTTERRWFWLPNPAIPSTTTPHTTTNLAGSADHVALVGTTLLYLVFPNSHPKAGNNDHIGLYAYPLPAPP